MVYERIKKLYIEGKINSLTNYIAKGIITKEQAEEIMSAK